MKIEKSFICLVKRISDERLNSFLNLIGWWKNLKTLTLDILCWDNNGNGSPVDGVSAVSTWEEVIRFAKAKEAHSIVYIESSQLFLDVAIIQKGLEQVNNNTDYFTQWEHCRLPVGIGARIFFLNTPVIKNWQETPEDLIDHIHERPYQFNVRYDFSFYTHFDESITDSRYTSGQTTVFTPANKESFRFGLKGFQKFSEKYGKKKLKISPNGCSKYTDERYLPAAFGFESNACANFPTYIMFDVTNVCNAKCIHCPHSTFKKQKPAQHLDLKLFKHVINQCIGKPLNFIRITADGEPLLHPSLTQMVEYTTNKGVGPVGLTTNGSLMDGATAEALMDAGLFMVDFSLDAVLEKTYQKIRQGLSYQRVFKNIERFLNLKEKKSSKIKVMVSFVKQKENCDEVDQFIERWRNVADKVLIRELHASINTVNMAEDEEYASMKRWPCPHFFRRMVISYDGLIKTCPIDWQNATSFKSVEDIDIYDAWHGEYYWKKRGEQLNLDFKKRSVCKKCDDWRHTPWDLGYEKLVSDLDKSGFRE